MTDPLALPLAEDLVLPCGARLRNRVAKAAMSEQLATRAHDPSSALSALYERWAGSGAGLLITGNVMVDRGAVSEPRQVVVDERTDLGALGRWAGAARRGGSHAWVQLNHAGRQVPRLLAARPLAPTPVRGPGPKRLFGVPRAMDAHAIDRVVGQFHWAAGRAVAAGFSGVQVHAAHGYLLSQFLSPAANTRSDAWGGDPVRRRRLLGEVVGAVRDAIGPHVPLGVKLNSSDFQRYGTQEGDAAETAVWLGELGVDLLEISGGTFEATAMTGTTRAQAERRGARGAYFMEFARRVRGQTTTPLMLTGGFRTAEAMQEAVSSGVVDVVGLARPLALTPGLPASLLAGERASVAGPTRPLPSWSRRTSMLAGLAEVAWHTEQLRRLALGRPPEPDERYGAATARYLARQAVQVAQSRTGPSV